jgi:hypothetical protein
MLIAFHAATTPILFSLPEKIQFMDVAPNQIVGIALR